MFELSIADKDLLSHMYLKQLISQQGLRDFTLINKQLSSVEATKSRSSNLRQLVIFSEGLQLQHLSLVTQALAEYLELAFYRVIQVEGVSGVAVCAYVTAKTSNNLNTQLEDLANRFSVELCLTNQVPTLSEPGLLLMDMDSTVIAVECIDEIAALAGVGQQVADVTAQAMQGQLDFADSLRTRVACLAAADESILQQVRDALPLMPGVANLVTLLKQYNWKVAIASGGFTYFADYLGDRLELDATVANGLQIEDAKLTGKVQGDIVDAKVKADTLVNLANKWDIPLSQTIAMGDGANDLQMMSAASLGVALHAKPVVRQQADIAIRRGGLDCLLWVLAAKL